MAVARACAQCDAVMMIAETAEVNTVSKAALTGSYPVNVLGKTTTWQPGDVAAARHLVSRA